MELGKREKAINDMIKQISAIRNDMHDNYKQINQVSSQNKLLDLVISDYKEYFEHMIEQKKQKCRALEAISDYIEDVSNDFDNTHYLIREAKMDQKDISKELSKTKKELLCLTMNK